MKRKLIKVIGISFLIFFVLSWIIPTGTYTGGKLSTDSIAPIGLIDLFNKPIQAIVTFALYGVVFAAIGGFYGVLEKTLVLDGITDKWSSKFSDKGNKFLIITTILFVLLSSLTGLIIPLFILVPLFARTLFKLNYDKLTVLASTVGGILTGSIGSTYGFNITGYTKNLLSLDMNNQILPRIIVLVILTIVLCVTVVLSSKKSENNDENLNEAKKPESKNEVKKAEVGKDVKEVKNSKTDNVEEKKSSKKTGSKGKKGSKKTSKSNTKNMAISQSIKKVSDKPVKTRAFTILFILMLIVMFVGMYNWYYSFSIDAFTKIHEAVMGVKVSGFKIFENLLSGASQFGYWSNVEFVGLIVFTSMVIGKVYKLSLNDYVEGFISGMKAWMPTAIYVCLANVVLVVLYQSLQSGTGSLVDTINGTILGWADGFNPIITGLATFISSFFFNDLYYLLADLSAFTSGYSSSDLSVAGMLIQSVYAVAMMIMPVSTVLIAGLSMFDVSYGKWMKYIWRFALISLLLVMIVGGVLTLL